MFHFLGNRSSEGFSSNDTQTSLLRHMFKMPEKAVERMSQDRSGLSHAPATDIKA